MIRPAWIAVDWGTSSLRAWAMGAGGEILASAASAQGMLGLEPADFEPALVGLIAPWLSASETTPVVGCGMVGSKQGWLDVPYLEAPCAPSGTLVAAPVSDPRIAVWICPGIKQPAPPDVMRGEETQIAGLLAGQPGFDGTVCLPGTHSKWARVGNGEIREFQTFLTGELFALLALHSVLRHSVARDGWDADAFLDAVAVALRNPESVAASLFAIRAGSLLHGLDAASARARLSGLLIGWELAATRHRWELGGEIAIVAAPEPGDAYKLALEAQGVTAQFLPAEPATLTGLQTTLDHDRRPR